MVLSKDLIINFGAKSDEFSSFLCQEYWHQAISISLGSDRIGRGGASRRDRLAIAIT